MDFDKVEHCLKSFLLEAGALALEQQGKVTCYLKAGTDALTDADLAISELAQARLANSFADTFLIDEESIGSQTPENVFSKTTYQWVLDPIDGTAGYAMGRFMWGVFLSFCKGGVPILGGVYLPTLGRMVLSTQSAVQHVLVEQGQVQQIQLKKHDMNAQVFVDSDKFSGRKWGKVSAVDKIWPNSPESSAQGIYSVFSGQSAGMVFTKNHSFWDIAMALAAVEQTCFTIKSLSNGEAWRGDPKQYLRATWKLKDDWLLCHPENFEYIRSALF